MVDSEKDEHTESRKINLLIDKKVRKQLVEKVIKLVDSEKDVHTERRKISLLIDKVRKQLVEKVIWLTVRKMDTLRGER